MTLARWQTHQPHSPRSASGPQKSPEKTNEGVGWVSSSFCTKCAQKIFFVPLKKCCGYATVSKEQYLSMSLYQRGKSWYYDFLYRGERYAGCIGPVSKTVAKEIMAKKKAEAVEGRYELPSQKPSPQLKDFAKEY